LIFSFHDWWFRYCCRFWYLLISLMPFSFAFFHWYAIFMPLPLISPFIRLFILLRSLFDDIIDYTLILHYIDID
jgi:hypothetical protein